ncbi:YihY/virulence factor BrkB family protein [Neorhodopirellula pilleata]|uniref:Uncharacterized protein n=1 Tax=Neorhodopirellula pilleata TaxID=2714738 RepID=A0A5C6AVY3_9BACT|nr:YihY/virulence factor BrkB family protein [Neorhodopirellula pilleata]TWU03212.1 hypothetical protein Pla100_01300 [Neorhodopirellula pilleata]
MDFLKKTFNEFLKNDCTTLAAALSYYTAFALPPLMYLLLTVLTFGLSTVYEGEQAQEKAMSVLKAQSSQMLGNPAASDAITKILENNQQAGGKWWKTLLSFVGIVIGATGVVAALQAALNQVWEVKPDPETTGIKDIFLKRLLSFGMILGLGFLLLVSLILSSILSAVGEQVSRWIGMSETIMGTIDFLVQALVVMVVFASIFKFMPDVVVRWRDVLVGAAITTVLFIVGRYALQWYFSYSDPAAQFSAAAASLAVLLIWVYYTSMIVLLGAEATQVYSVRYGHGIRPEPNAVRVSQKIQRQPT